MELERTAKKAVAKITIEPSVAYAGHRVSIKITDRNSRASALLSPSEVDDLIVMLTYYKLEAERKEKEDAATKKSSG